MSRQLPDAFRGGAVDPSLSYIGQEDEVDFQQQLDSVFGTFAQDPTFNNSPADSDVLDDFSSNYDESVFSSAATSGVSSPDFSSFNFGHRVQRSLPSNYPPPGPGTPNPYPIQLQRQQYGVEQHSLQLPHRPAPVRSVTNIEVPRPQGQQYSARVNQPFHRRSLSQGDADLLASKATNSHFLRLQTSRGRSAAPEPNRGRPVGGKVRGGAPTSAPWDMHMSPPQMPRAREQQMPTFSRHDGTPIGVSLTTPDLQHTDGRGSGKGQMSHRAPAQMKESPPYMTREYSQGQSENSRPRYELRHMSEEDKARESRRVIEIGAMMVLNRDGLSSGTASKGSQQEKNGVGDGGQYDEDNVLDIVGQMESHILRTGDPSGKGLAAVELFREVLAERAQAAKEKPSVQPCNNAPNTSPDPSSNHCKHGDENASPYINPSDIFSEADSLFNAHTPPNDDFYAMMMADSEATDFSTTHEKLDLNEHN